MLTTLQVSVGILLFIAIFHFVVTIVLGFLLIFACKHHKELEDMKSDQRTASEVCMFELMRIEEDCLLFS